MTRHTSNNSNNGHTAKPHKRRTLSAGNARSISMYHYQQTKPSTNDFSNRAVLTTWNRGWQAPQTAGGLEGRPTLISRKSNFSSSFLRYTQQMHLARAAEPERNKKSVRESAVLQKGIGSVAALQTKESALTARDPLLNCKNTSRKSLSASVERRSTVTTQISGFRLMMNSRSV